MPLTIGISLGDFTGIGPETALKAIAAEFGTDQTRYLLIGDQTQTRALNEQLGLKLPVPSNESSSPLSTTGFL
jgi:4-hydroxy-L-threonine phosphate dehydrogenase PdxA